MANRKKTTGYIIRQAVNEQYYFATKHRNGKIGASSLPETYTQKQNAFKGIAAELTLANSTGGVIVTDETADNKQHIATLVNGKIRFTPLL